MSEEPRAENLDFISLKQENKSLNSVEIVEIQHFIS